LERLPDSAGDTAAAGIKLRLFLVFLPIFLAAYPRGAAGSFPLVMKDDRGATVRLSSPPRRVVSLAPNLTEIVFLLGQEERLVGVTRYGNYPPRASILPRIGGIVDPDVERIVAAGPDLVLCTTDGNPKERVRVLEEMGIPCFAVGPQDLEAVFETIERIGTLLGVPERAGKETAALRIRASRASRSHACTLPGAETTEGKGVPKPRVLFALSTSPVIAAGVGTFLDELLRAAGGENAASSFAGRYPRLSVENLLAAGPDMIFLAAMDGVESFPAEVTRWEEIPAFRDGEIVTLDGDLVTRPGPRMVAALEEISRALRGWCHRRIAATSRDEEGRR
jgi:iron complex transport system substrate-binding protein